MRDKLFKCEILLVFVIILVALNLPPYEEVVYEDAVVAEEVESEEVAEQKITVHDEEVVASYDPFPRNGGFGMEVADIEYLALMDKIGDGCLTASKGVHHGVSGKETWYNKPMGGVIEIMRHMGYDEVHYPYWVREDGVKMLGDYVMCAADLRIRPRGTILQTSLGPALVCDTGDFIHNNQTQIDIATDW